VSFSSSSSSIMKTKPSECRGAYGGGADDRVEWWGRTGGSSISPWGLVNLINEFHVALMFIEEKSVIPPRWFRVLLNTPRIVGNRAPPGRGCRWWLRRRWSLLLWWKSW
jgi:hypothetical protein